MVREMGRCCRMLLILVLAVVLSTLGAALPLTTAGAAALDWDIPGGHYFTQTNGQPLGASQAGFSVTNADGVPFWTEFNRAGGLQIVGYPISRRFVWEGFVTQVFQKAIFQWKVAEQRVDFVNTFDQMSLKGKDEWLLSAKSTPKSLDAASFDAGKSWDQIVAARQTLLNAAPAIKAVYHSVPDPIRLFGLPTSAVIDNGNHYAIRLQRAVLQQWKVAVPWAAAGQVTVGNGGDIFVQAGVVSGDSLKPQVSPTDGTAANPGGATAPLPAQPPVPAPATSPAPNPQAPTGLYRVTVDREGQDWYKERGGVYFQTSTCYQYAYSEEAIYDADQHKLTFKNGRVCRITELITSYVKSQIAGTFTGWSGDTLFPLTNGQVWQQASYAYTYHYAYRPGVIIYESTYGYKMRVQDMDEALPVRRVK